MCFKLRREVNRMLNYRFRNIIRLINQEEGFTILELITVIMLVGILSYTAISEFSNSTSSIKEMTFAKKVVADIRYAQEMAISNQKTVKCLIDPSQNRYSLKWENDTHLKTPIAEKDFIVDIDLSNFIGVKITSTNFSSGLLIYDSQGQPFNGDSPLSSETTLMVINKKVTIKIVPGTGRCYIDE
jgi:prepilin-type N-terminal cleavage/methylation domain-containing protein